MSEPAFGDGTKRIVLINPNTSERTTAMMVAIARSYLPAGFAIEGLTAKSGVPMIVDPEQLAASVTGVVAMGLSVSDTADGIIVGAFGDPGLEQLKEGLTIPVTGICEASMREASAGGRRFAIATVTPHLVESFAEKAAYLGLSGLYAGTRLTEGDPIALAADPERLHAALLGVVRQCFDMDGARAVIIGGGPLGQAAMRLQQELSAPVIAPIRSAVARLVEEIERL
jgi:Asp/Glu/hydantoin racemase